MSTTTTKPPSVLKSDIRKVLDRMQVQYCETKAGFECIHVPSIDISSVPESSQVPHSSHHHRHRSSGSNETYNPISGFDRYHVFSKSFQLTCASPVQLDQNTSVSTLI